MAATGIDGGIDGGNATGGGGGGPLPPLPPASVFSALVARLDRTAQAELGSVVVTYKPAAGSPIPVAGIFDAMYQLAKGDAEAGVETLGPAVFFRLADLPVDPELDEPTLTIDGRDYRVLERRPDDQGGIVMAIRLVT